MDKAQLVDKGEEELRALLSTISEVLATIAQGAAVPELQELRTRYQSHTKRLREIFSEIDQVQESDESHETLEAQRDSLIKDCKNKDSQLRQALQHLRALQFDVSTMSQDPN